MSARIVALYALLLHLSTQACATPHNLAPHHTLTRTAREKALSALRAHKRHVTALPELRKGAAPLFYLHPEGTRVHGTVVIYHGFGGFAPTSAQQARILFKRKFNVVAFNLAGLAQTPRNWRRTILRDTYGFSAARKRINSDRDASRILSDIKNANTAEKQLAFLAQLSEPIAPIFSRALRGSRFKRTRDALKLLTAEAAKRRSTKKRIRNAFYTNHLDYDSYALMQLSIVQALPGPTHAIGYSLGCSVVMRLAAFSQVLSRIVLLAPFYAKFDDPLRKDVTEVIATVGALDLINLPSGAGPAPASATTAAIVYAASSRRNDITRRVRKSANTLCIMAGDDATINVVDSLHICKRKLGGIAFVYPKKLGIGHAVTPESGNIYGEAMMVQVGDFLIKGSIDRNRFLVAK